MRRRGGRYVRKAIVRVRAGGPPAFTRDYTVLLVPSTSYREGINIIDGPGDEEDREGKYQHDRASELPNCWA